MKTIMSVCSIEIVVSRSLAKRNILFDERFGLGTDFSTGGENIMLLDALRQGVKITRHPAVIVQHPVSSSGSGSRGLSQLAFAKGAMFRRMFGFIGILLVVWFMLRSSLSDQPPRFSAKHYIHALSGFLKAPVYKVTRQEDD